MGPVIPHLSSWLLVIAAGVNSCIGNLLLKQSQCTRNADGLVGLLSSPWFVGGLVFYGVNVILFAKALEHLPMSSAYSVLASVAFALVAGPATRSLPCDEHNPEQQSIAIHECRSVISERDAGITDRDVAEGSLSLFVSDCRYRIKALWSHGDDFCLWYKRLLSQRFQGRPRARSTGGWGDQITAAAART